MADLGYPEITVNRKSQGDAADEPVSPAPPRVRRTAPSGKNGTGKGTSGGTKGSGKDTKRRDPDEWLRHVTSVLLLLFSVLLFLSLISYTPADQANADVGVGDLAGLVSNDPTIAARADTTENWIGLMGAFISNFLINGTVGYGAIVIPVLMALWGMVVFKATGYSRLIRATLSTLLVVTLIAGIFGTIQLVSWMPHPSYEFSGAIGSFIASILSGLIGTAGSILVLLAAIFVSVVHAFELDMKTIVDMGRRYFIMLRAQAARTREAVSAKLGENAEATESAPVDERRPTGDGDRIDNEPARMVRRMGGSALPPVDDTPTVVPPRMRREEAPFPEARIARPAHLQNPVSEGTTLPPVQTQRPVQPQPQPRPVEPRPMEPRPAQTRHPEESAPEPRRAAEPPNRGLDIPMPSEQAQMRAQAEPSPLPPAAPRPPVRETPQAEQRDENIEVRHDAPPLSPQPSATAPTKLTVNVYDAETDADLETEDEGGLIERYRDEQIKYVPPPVELLVPQSEQADVNDSELKENARILQEKLSTFNIQIENLTVTPGPVVTLYEFVPAAGIKIAQIESLADDIALALKARGIRIIAPIPGKGTVGVEIPNHKPAMVRIRSVVNTAKFREANLHLPLALGKTTVGEVFCDDLTKMPHLLIAGATGSGKSVGINAILSSLLFKMHPSELKFVIIDPKKIELTQYKALKDHFLACCPDIDEDIITNPQNAVIALKSLEMEMDRRYDILARGRQRNIFDYNRKVDEGYYKDDAQYRHVKLPYIVLILDELADLMITAAREVEEPIARLAQLARAIGIHMVVATQRPSVDVITGMIKANFPARIAYQVATKIDSRTILDMNGAEQLLGNGDMLFLPGGQPKPLRLQNAFISTDEVEELCDHIGKQKGYTQPYMLPSVVEKSKKSGGGGDDARDELFDEAARLIVRHQQGSVSLVQRRLKVGYSRAARIIDELEMAGIVGPFDGSKARAVLLESEAELEAFL